MLFLPTLLKGIGTGLSLFGASRGASASAQAAANSIAAAEQNRYAVQASLDASQDTISAANTNYGINRQNAQAQRTNTLAGIDIDQASNRIAFGAASTNLQLSLMDAKAREMNASRIRQFAEAKTTASRKELRRQKRSFDQFESRQKAIIGSSGVSFEGSVLDVMAESAGQMQLTLQDMHEQANFDRTSSYGDAAGEDFGASQERIAAKSRYGDARSAFDIGNGVAKLGRLAANQNYQSNLSSAYGARADGYMSAAGQQLSAAGQAYGTASQYTQAAGQYASASNQRFSAIGGIFAGAAGYATDRYNIKQNGIR